MEKNSSSYTVLYFIRLVGNLYMLYFCVYNDFYQQKQIVKTYLAGGM